MSGTFDDDVIRTEAVLFGRYLTGVVPSDAAVDRYAAALRTGRFDVDDREQRTIGFVVRHPWMLGIIDGGLGLRRPRSVIRVRLLAMTSILEATTDQADAFLPIGRTPFHIFYIGLVGVRAGIRGAIGAVLVTWI